MIGLVVAGFALTAVAAEDVSPLRSDPYSSDENPPAIDAAKKRGAVTAAKDIASGTFRILTWGEPTPPPAQTPVDDATGFRIHDLGTCGTSGPFLAELIAYDDAMREWHRTHKRAKDSK